MYSLVTGILSVCTVTFPRPTIYLLEGKADEQHAAFVDRAKKPIPIPEVVLDEDHSSAPNYFAKIVRSMGKIDDLVNPAFNLDVQEIIEAAIRSSRSGLPVNLPLK